MTFPKIAYDDLLLFGSLFWFGTGAGITAAAMTGDVWLGVGVWMIGFGLPSALVTFMASAVEEPK